MKAFASALAIFTIQLPSIHSFSCRAKPRCSINLNMASNSEPNQTSSSTCTASRKSKRLYSFDEARKIARGHGFSSRQEFIDYDCAGAYQLPKDPDLVWKDDWRGWDDFLGVPLQFEEVSIIDTLMPYFRSYAITYFVIICLGQRDVKWHVL
jgi:hypothetical protein